MARLIALAFLLAISVACSHKPAAPPWDDSPDFNNCWRLFPPGPDFEKQMEEYAGTNDANVIELGCIPLYHLNESACQSFQKVGEGEWPPRVVDWCRRYFNVELKNL